MFHSRKFLTSFMLPLFIDGQDQSKEEGIRTGSYGKNNS